MDTQFKLSQYKAKHKKDIFSVIEEDPEWCILTKDELQKNTYARLLEKSVTFVAYSGEYFCGYIRAILDDGFAIYISELFVKPKYRNNKLGEQLILKVKENYDPITVYALSDEDQFYEKKGFKKIGSVFEI